MKLYTEEQVRKSFYNGIRYASSIHLASFSEQNKYVDKIIDTLTPIELPSDEEIEEESSKWKAPGQAFRGGAKWMRDKILNQNK
jgi:hypothetical protein